MSNKDRDAVRKLLASKFGIDVEMIKVNCEKAVEGTDKKPSFAEFLAEIASKMKEAEASRTDKEAASLKSDEHPDEDDDRPCLHPAMDQLTPANCVNLLQEINGFMLESFGDPSNPSSTASDRAFTYINALLTRMDEMRNNNLHSN